MSEQRFQSRLGECMTTSSSVFDKNISVWKKEQEQPWQILKYKLAKANIDKYLHTGKLKILDVGGGNGVDSLDFAKAGHSVHIVDYAKEMLTEAIKIASSEKAEDNITTHHADIQEVSSLFPSTKFDLILCHNVLQYIDDVASLMKSLINLLKPGGLLSVISINRYSIPYQRAFLHGDLQTALAEIGTREFHAYSFDTKLINYSVEEIAEMLEETDVTVEADYGIRNIYDYWGDNDKKSDPEIQEQLEKIEFELTDKYPYKLLARYYQIIARKE